MRTQCSFIMIIFSSGIFSDALTSTGLILCLCLVPITGQGKWVDKYPIINNKILSTATPYRSGTVRSRIHCADMCSREQWKCFGANVRAINGAGPPYLCEMFWVTLSDLSVLTDSPGDMYLNPGRPNYWTAAGTGLSGLSTVCSMCICRASGCEARIGVCKETWTTVCGPYGMTKPLWCDATNPAACDDTIIDAYETCAKDMTCSQTQIANYLARYEDTCTGGATPTCRHYAIALSSGPNSCSTPTAYGLTFWDAVNVCCTNHGGC